MAGMYEQTATTESPMFKPGQIALNVLANGRTLATVRIMGEVRVGDEVMYRVVDVRHDTGATDKQLIARNKTWAVSAENLRATEA